MSGLSWLLLPTNSVDNRQLGARIRLAHLTPIIRQKYLREMFTGVLRAKVFWCPISYSIWTPKMIECRGTLKVAVLACRKRKKSLRVCTSGSWAGLEMWK